MKMLVVDDEADVKLLFEQKFRREIKEGKVEMLFALSGEQALQILNNNGSADVVLILSDINMPGMSGLELLHIIKTNTPDQKVFMITAYSDESNYRKAVEYGADDYITKPIDFEPLKKRILADAPAQGEMK